MAQLHRLYFLVYDSRSGSTLLARLLQEYTPLYVTPEIAFDRVLRITESQFQTLSANRKRELLSAEPNLAFSEDIWIRVIESSRNRRTFILNILEAFRTSRGIPDEAELVIKHGNHAFYWRELSAMFGETAAFIHVYRDPRAVISSKTNIPRPYAPHECMAWGGPLLAGWRWRSYMRVMRKAEKGMANIMEISFERLLQDSTSQIWTLSNHFGLTGRPSKRAEYDVPQSELSIHPMVGKPPDPNRIASWRTELSPWTIRQIEAVTLREMLMAGYPPQYKDGILMRIMVVAGGLPGLVFRIARHFLQKYLHRK